jgi:hypothetical protein
MDVFRGEPTQALVIVSPQFRAPRFTADSYRIQDRHIGIGCMLGFMSETTSSSEPATGPVATAAPPPTPAEPQRHSRLSAVAAWVGIVAGVVFIVAVIFFSGFILGAHSGGHRGGWHHGGGHHGFAMMHHGGPPMFQMGPRGDRPWPPFGPGGPGGPNFQGPSPQQPTSPSTTPAPRP